MGKTSSTESYSKQNHVCHKGRQYLQRQSDLFLTQIRLTYLFVWKIQQCSRQQLFLYRCSTNLPFLTIHIYSTCEVLCSKRLLQFDVFMAPNGATSDEHTRKLPYRRKDDQRLIIFHRHWRRITQLTKHRLKSMQMMF